MYPGTQSDAVVIAVDYEGLDSGQLTELKQEANKEHLDSLSKKKRKKLLKKRTKEMLRKAKVVKFVMYSFFRNNHVFLYSTVSVNRHWTIKYFRFVF